MSRRSSPTRSAAVRVQSHADGTRTNQGFKARIMSATDRATSVQQGKPGTPAPQAAPKGAKNTGR